MATLQIITFVLACIAVYLAVIQNRQLLRKNRILIEKYKAELSCWDAFMDMSSLQRETFSNWIDAAIETEEYKTLCECTQGHTYTIEENTNRCVSVCKVYFNFSVVIKSFNSGDKDNDQRDAEELLNLLNKQ